MEYERKIITMEFRVKWGIINKNFLTWYYPACITLIDLNPNNFKSKIDSKFETEDINIAYRYLAALKAHGNYSGEVRERNQQ